MYVCVYIYIFYGTILNYLLKTSFSENYLHFFVDCFFFFLILSYSTRWHQNLESGSGVMEVQQRLRDRNLFPLHCKFCGRTYLSVVEIAAISMESMGGFKKKTF